MGERQLPNSVSLEFIEALYADYLRDPEFVPADWRQYFQSLSEGNGFSKGQRLSPTFRPWSVFNPLAASGNGAAVEEATGAILQERIDQLIRNYRVRGHMAAQLDPLGIPRAAPPELDLEFYGFTENDLDRRFSCEAMCGGNHSRFVRSSSGSRTRTAVRSDAIEDRPEARDGTVVIRPMMYVALTYDHRIVDGREAVTFLKRVKDVIEEPAKMLLEI